MEYVGTKSLKKSYAQALIQNDNIKRGIKVFKKNLQEPIFEGYALHSESEPLKEDINNSFTEIGIDIAGLNKEFLNLSREYSSLVNNVTERLNAVEERIKKEENRIRDMNIICNRYRQIDSIIELTPGNISTNASYENGVFMGSLNKKKRDLKPLVLEVLGNGEEKDEKERGNLVDNDPLTSWTYIKKRDKKNKSEENTICSILLFSDEPFNMIKIQSGDNIIVEDVQTSSDEGLTYASNMSDEIHINSQLHRYDNPDYIYEAGIIAFPFTKFAKIRIKSEKQIITLDGISIAGSSYGEGIITKTGFITSPVESISVYANEYIPSHFISDKYIEYILTINGKDYEIVPLNSHKPGIKVIRFANYSNENNYTEHLNETIKTAKLKVIIHVSRNGETPFVSNLKICLGKAVI
nr:MAG TPA: hypothetical protein [Caudoviricetes sp.]